MPLEKAYKRVRSDNLRRAREHSVESPSVASLLTENRDLKLNCEKIKVEISEIRADNEVLRRKSAEIGDDLKKTVEQIAEEKKKSSHYQEQALQLEKKLHQVQEDRNLQVTTVSDLKMALSEQKKQYGEQMSRIRVIRSVDSAAKAADEVDSLQKQVQELVAKSPSAGKKLKSYELTGRDSRIDRFQRVVRSIEEFVGNRNIDVFLRDFILWISSNPSFSFSLALDEWMTYLAAIKFNFSDGFLKLIKKFLYNSLGFDVFASRKAVDCLKRKCDPRDNYTIRADTSTRTTPKNKVIRVTTPFVVVKSVSSLLKERLERRSKTPGGLLFDSGTGDDIVIGVGGDKGGALTKLCLILENQERPNNPKSISILGFYAGADDHANLKEKFGPVFEQLNNLKSIKYLDAGVEVERAVRIKPTGDCKFLSALFGHSGQSSNSPCFVCEASWVKAGQNMATVSTFPFDVPGRLRTLQSLDATGTPLLRVEPSLAGPPGVHVILGLVQSYLLDWLYALCNRIDFDKDILPCDLKGQRKVLKNLQIEEDSVLTRIRVLHDSIDVAFSVLEAYKKNSNPRIHPLHSCSSDCCVIHLITQKKDSLLETFTCQMCRKEYHVACCGGFTPDDVHRFQTGRSTCCTCLQPGNHKSIEEKHREVAMEALERLREQLENDQDLYDTVADEREQLEGQLHASTGATRKKLEAVLRSIGCDSRIWFQSLNGNQARDLLRPESLDKIFAIFPSSVELDLMRVAAKELAFIMSAANNNVKTDGEIDGIEESISSFSRALRIAQPNASVTPKLHILTSHLVPYMRETRSWGRVTEQGIESIHAVFNGLDRRYSSVRDVQLNATLVLQMFCNYNLLDDTGFSF